VRVSSYPVEERKGLIWVFIGDRQPPPFEEDVPEDILDEKAVLGIRVTRESAIGDLQQKTAWTHLMPLICTEMPG
jgi:phenylpropionate dioxygenase-like ring-hydroxylating dioxygenase large terminal subunit